MPSRSCLNCGGALPANASASRRYCCERCRKAYNRRIQKGGAVREKSRRRVVDVRDAAEASTQQPNYRQLLELSRVALMRALDDEATPANAIAALSRQLLAVGKEIQTLDPDGEADPILDDTEGDGTDEPLDPETL